MKEFTLKSINILVFRGVGFDSKQIRVTNNCHPQP